MNNHIYMAIKFMDRLAQVHAKDDADYALQHMKLCLEFTTENNISMGQLAAATEQLHDSRLLWEH